VLCGCKHLSALAEQHADLIREALLELSEMAIADADGNRAGGRR